jgi:uncharacterized protein YjiS (DUF1127 family)
MSNTLSTIVRPAIARRADAFSRLFLASVDEIVRYFACRAAVTSLCEFDDRALRDIGLVRCQIEAAVHGFLARPDRRRMM